MPTLARTVRPEQRDHVIGTVGVRGPDLGAVYHPAVGCRFRLRAQRSQIGAGIRFAHADAETGSTRGDLRDDLVLLRFRPVADDQRSALTVGDPMETGGRTCGEAFLDNDVAFEGAEAVPTVRFG